MMARYKPRRDIYKEVTDWVLAQIESHLPVWRRPWTPTGFSYFDPFNVSTGKPYNGINKLLLSMKAVENGDPRFLTYKQASELGFQVNKGEKASRVIFFDARTNPGQDENDTETYYVARAYSVFNANQVAGMPDLPHCEKNWDDSEIGKVYLEHIINNLNTDLKFGGDRALYVNNSNIIRLPDEGVFHSQAMFFAALSHELVHRTAPLLDRDTSNYAMEELVAELGSMYLSRALHLPYDPQCESNSASYIKIWDIQKSVQDDKYFIFKASRLAQQAVEHIISPELTLKIDAIIHREQSLERAVSAVSSPSPTTTSTMKMG